MAQKNRANMLTDIVSNIYNNLINFITGQNAQDRFVNLLDSSPNILSDASQPNGYVSTDANNEMFSSYYDEEISRADLITDLTANLAVGGKFYRINDAVGATITLLVIAESNVNLYSIGTDIATGEQGTYDITTDVFTPIVVSGTPDLQQVTDVGFTTTNKLKSDNGAGGVSSLNGGTIDLTTGGATVNINASLVTTTYNAQLPDKLTSPQTFAMLSDITSGGGIPHATAAGVDTYTATVSGVASYTDGDAYLVRFTNGNTTSATLNINSLGAKSLYRNNDGAIIGGDIWDGGEMLCVFNTTLDAFQCIGTSPNSIFAYVTNDDSVSITKGQVVYAFGGTGDRMTVKLANNTSDATSARTVGVVLSTSIAANQKGIIILQGLLDGLSILPTSTYADGDSIYLGATAGSITNVKQYAPNHLVYVATVTTASNGSAGRMYVRVQNGYELDELHNVQAQSPTLNDTLYYDNTVSPAQWKTASISTISGLKAPIVSVGNGTAVTGTTAITICKTLSIPANSFAAGDAPQLYFQTSKIPVVVSGTQTLRVYWNTSASLTGAILLGSTGAAVATVQSQYFTRHMGIEVANGIAPATTIFTPTLGSNNPYGAINGAITTVLIDWTQPAFIIVTIQNTSTTDISNCNLISLK
jgi:hypothetical protein